MKKEQLQKIQDAFENGEIALEDMIEIEQNNTAMNDQRHKDLVENWYIGSKVYYRDWREIIADEMGDRPNARSVAEYLKEYPEMIEEIIEWLDNEDK